MTQNYLGKTYIRISKKLNRATAILDKVRHYVHKSSLKTLYYSFFQSYLSYGCLVWGFANKCLVNKIFCIQKRATRLISFSSIGIKLIPRFFFINSLSSKSLTSLQYFSSNLYMTGYTNDYQLNLKTCFNPNHPNITTYVETMTRCHYLLDALANGGLIRYGIKVQSFITV